MRFVMMTALRYFYTKKSNKTVAFISGFSLLGITLGVAALIVVMSVMNGFHEDLKSSILGIGGHVYITSTHDKIEHYESVVQSLKKKDTVQYAVPLIEMQSLIIAHNKPYGVMVRGIDARDFEAKSRLFNSILSGNIEEINDGFNVALGHEIASTLNVKVGDVIRVISPNTVTTIMGAVPRSKDCTVVAIFSSGVYEYDVATVIMSLSSAQKLFSFSDSVNKIEVYIHDSEKTVSFASALRRELPAGYYVSSWLERNAAYLNALYTERIVMFLILSLIILVAAFNIVSSLFMLVNDKMRDIAILRTIGASRSQIMQIFIITGSMIGVIGTLSGAILGVFIAKNIESVRGVLEFVMNVDMFDASLYSLYHLPSRIIASDVVVTVALALSLSVLATVYPALRAARLDPVEGLRNG